MNYLTPVLKKYQKFFRKALIITLISLIISFFMYLKIDNSIILSSLKNISDLLKNNHFNLIFTHFNNISSLIMLTLLGLGFIVIPFYFIMELTYIFYNIFIFLKFASFKGFLFSLIYNFTLKGIYLILAFILLKKVLNIFRLISKSLINKISIDKNIFLNNLKFLIISLFLLIINDIFLYFYGTKILLKFLFILN